MRKYYEIIEDNGGGVYLAILECAGVEMSYGDTCLAIFEGFEYQEAGTLRESVEMLNSDPDSFLDWDGRLEERLEEDPDELYKSEFEHESDEHGNTVILRRWFGEPLNITGKDFCRMGTACRKALGLPREWDDDET